MPGRVEGSGGIGFMGQVRHSPLNEQERTLGKVVLEHVERPFVRLVRHDGQGDAAPLEFLQEFGDMRVGPRLYGPVSGIVGTRAFHKCFETRRPDAIRFPFGQGPADEHTQAVADELTVGGDGMLRVTC